MLIIHLFVLIGFFSLSQTQNRFMPNLPLGEYRVVFDKIYSCESTKNHTIQFNVYFNRKTLTMTELKGNLSFLIPFDDTLVLDLNVAAWGSTGGWIPNSHIFIAKKACSMIKNLFGDVWYIYQKAINMPTSSCPVPVGTYVISGIDLTTLIGGHNFPKVFFYGKYKILMKIKNAKNEIIGCKTVELNLIRLWEKPI